MPKGAHMKLDEALKVKKGAKIFAYSKPFKVSKIQKVGRDIWFVSKDGVKVYYRVASLELKDAPPKSSEQIQDALNKLPGAPAPMPVQFTVPPVASGRQPLFDVEIVLNIKRPNGSSTTLCRISGAGMFVGDPKYYADIAANNLGPMVAQRMAALAQMGAQVAAVQQVIAKGT